ncbi:MAG: hypothetical protein IJ731_09840 [Eubacterium sp.]|nr:hypothetical protein [Eubacterium sp.]
MDNWFENIQGFSCPICHHPFLIFRVINDEIEFMCSECGTVFNKDNYKQYFYLRRQKMSNRRGRPKSSEPIHEVQYRLRLTPDEHRFLKALSKEYNISMSDLIRVGALYFRDRAIRKRNSSNPYGLFLGMSHQDVVDVKWYYARKDILEGRNSIIFSEKATDVE